MSSTVWLGVLPGNSRSSLPSAVLRARLFAYLCSLAVVAADSRPAPAGASSPETGARP